MTPASLDILAALTLVVAAPATAEIPTLSSTKPAATSVAAVICGARDSKTGVAAAV